MPTLKFGGRETDWLLIGIAASCAVLAWVFVRIGAEVTQGTLTGVDVSIREFVSAHRSGAGDAFFSAITLLGSKPVLVVVAVVVGWWLSNRSKTVVLLVALCGLVSAEFVDLLKEGFGVVRPPAEIMTSRSLSFPSGHVAGAASIATLLSYVSWRRHRARRFVIPASVLVVVLMAVSRVYLDKHWTSDTIGGALVGVTLGLACSALYEWIARHGPPTQNAT